MTRHDEQAPPAQCPRCGYDQRGIVATWKESCPLEGTCSECGLTFEWVDVLCPDKFEPPWCVEYTSGRRAVLRGSFGTLRQSCVPWRFWSRLKMSHPIQWNRVAPYLVFLLLLALFAYICGQSLLAVRVRYVIGQDIRSQPQEMRTAVRERRNYLAFTDPSELTDDEIRRSEAFIRAWEAKLATPVSCPVSYAEAIWRAVITPWSGSGGNPTTYGYYSWAYPPPCTLRDYLSRRTSSTGMPDDPEWMVPAAWFFAWWMGAFFLLPVGFLCLPVSRRRAKVRWAHIGRITAYGLCIPFILVSASLLAMAVGNIWTGAMAQLIFSAVVAALVLFLPLLIVWWGFAIGRYLRIPHAWVVSLLLAIMALLLPTGVMSAFTLFL